jgi:anti-sigma regulatory factor (Ser/Thr protein kinase)
MCNQVVEQLLADPRSAHRGRNLVATTCQHWALGESLCTDLALPVSELVTNAVLHAGTEIQLTVSLTAQWVEVSVRDQHLRAPVLRPVHLSPDALPSGRDLPLTAHEPYEDAGGDLLTSGRGLQIVDAVADEWGTETLATGKEVWFRVRTPPAWTPAQACECTQASGTTPGGLRYQPSSTP